MHMLLIAVLAAAPIQEGRGDSRDAPGPKVAPGATIEVIEFFSYSCPPCATIDPVVDRWRRKLPDDVSFRRVPVTFRAEWEASAKTFAILEKLGATDRCHASAFQFFSENGRGSRSEVLRDWVKSQGLDADVFMAAYTSFTIQTEVSRFNKLWRASGIDAVPSFTVAGKHRISFTGPAEAMLAQVDALVEKVRDERKEPP